jgi:hypothetical protein
MTTYNRTSPYYSTSLAKGYLDVATIRDFPKDADDITYTVTKEYEYRPDLLAYDLYKNSNLWWVFAIRNPSIIKDPIFDLEAGVVIQLPKISNLKNIIGS